eukprot:5076186-Pleurochrysis_carterae.AAC.1
MYASKRLAWSSIALVGKVRALARMPIAYDSPGRPQGGAVDVVLLASRDLVVLDELRRRGGIVYQIVGEWLGKMCLSLRLD